MKMIIRGIPDFHLFGPTTTAIDNVLSESIGTSGNVACLADVVATRPGWPSPTYKRSTERLNWTELRVPRYISTDRADF